jgi:rhodanese-related sulfurtransferase
MTVTELRSALDAGRDLVVLDVREPEELALAALPGVVHIPMRELPLRVAELPRDRDLAVLCHHGVRSAHVVQWLRQMLGFQRAQNVEGGIDAWSIEVDPSVPRY